jgi:hypothetical protein
MPRDQLMKFHCNKAIDVQLNLLLLQTHRKIRALRFPILFHGFDSPENDFCLSKMPWTSQYLQHLESLEINVAVCEEPSSFFSNALLRDYRSIIERAPMLKRLAIQIPRHQQIRDFPASIYGLNFTGQPGALRKLDLNELSLTNLDLAGSMSLM